MLPVHSVDALKLAIEKGIPSSWVISGECTACMAGHGEAVLRKVEYIEPPEDGIQDFQCLVSDAGSVGAPVLTGHVPFHGRLDEVPEWYRGIRIHAATNALVVPFRRDWRRTASGASRSPERMTENPSMPTLQRHTADGTPHIGRRRLCSMRDG